MSNIASTNADDYVLKKDKDRNIWNRRMQSLVHDAVQISDVRVVLETCAKVIEYWAGNLREDALDYCLAETNSAKDLRAFAGIGGPSWLVEDFTGASESIILLKFHKTTSLADDCAAKIDAVREARSVLANNLHEYVANSLSSAEPARIFKIEELVDTIAGQAFSVVKHIRLIASQFPSHRSDIMESERQTCVALLFAANPKGTARLALDEEVREIETKIRAAEHRDTLKLISKWAVRPDDLLQALNQYNARIVHFSGHGSPSDEIILTNDQGEAKPVSKAALSSLFKTLRGDVRLVILNACFSQTQAEAIAEHIDCTIGMSKAIGDKAAIKFAASVYRAIGFGKSVQDAFDQGITAILLEGIPEENTPQLLCRKGVDPKSVQLLHP